MGVPDDGELFEYILRNRSLLRISHKATDAGGGGALLLLLKLDVRHYTSAQERVTEERAEGQALGCIKGPSRTLRRAIPIYK